jgi:flagellar hook-length control protein FliK
MTEAIAATPLNSVAPHKSLDTNAQGGAQDFRREDSPRSGADPIAAPTTSAGTPAVTFGETTGAQPASGSPVTMQNLIDEVRARIATSVHQGTPLARIQLSPESLGGITIHLQSTDAGLVAKIVADHGEAAQALQQHGAELRRSLESAGVNVLKLDISGHGASGQNPGLAAHGGAAQNGNPNRNTGAETSTATGDTAGDGPPTAGEHSSADAVSTPGRVDVLA